MVPHIVLEEVGAAFELEFVDCANGDNKKPEYLALNPNGLVPVLIDGTVKLDQAAAICLHIAGRHPESRLVPDPGSVELSLCHMWLTWLSSELHPALSMYLHPRKWTDQENVRSELSQGAGKKVRFLFDIIDGHIAKSGGPYILGDRFSVVDAYAFVLCRWSRFMDRPGVEWPNFGPYARHILKRPSVTRVIAREGLVEPWL